MATEQYLTNFFNHLGYFQDRTIDDSLTLPYELEDVKIKPNDLAIADSFNTSIERIYHNMLYILSNSSFANNMTPRITWSSREEYEVLRVRNSYTLKWPERKQEYQHDTKVVSDILTTRSRYVDDITSRSYFCTILAEENKDSTSSLTLISNDPACHGSEGNEGSYSVLNRGMFDDIEPGTWSSNLIDEERVGETFKDIRSICVDSLDRLYVLDENVIYQYNIDGVLNRDLSLIRENMRIGRKLTNTLGVPNNLGGKTNKYGFENPSKVFTSYKDGDECLYVIDRDIDESETTTVAIKVYNTSLDWIKTYIIDDFSTIGSNEHNIVDIIPYSFSDGDGFISITSDHHFIYYDYEFNVTSEIDSGVDTVPKKIHTSKENPNILYIQTQEVVEGNKVVSPGTIDKRYISSVGKKFATMEDLLVCSSFGLEFLRLPIYSDVSGDPDRGWEPWALRQIEVVLDDNTGKDIIYMAYSTNVSGTINWNNDQNERVVCVLDAEHPISNLFDGYEESLYELEDIYIEKEEFVNSQVYNKALAKLIHNLTLLDISVKGKFENYTLSATEKTALNINTPVVLNGLVYRSEFELAELPTCEITLDNYIGINELVTSVVLNRCIEEAYCWLTRLRSKLDLTAGDEISRKFQLDGELITCKPQIPPTPSVTITPSITPSITVSSTITPTPSITATPTVTPTISISQTPTITPTPTVTPTIDNCVHGISTDQDDGIITDGGVCIDVDPEPSKTPTPTPTQSPTPTPTITPSTPTTPNTLLMLVNPGSWDHVSWTELFKCSTDTYNNDNGEYIMPSVTSSGTSRTTSIHSKLGDWNWEMQQIEISITQRWIITGVGMGQQWLRPDTVGDIRAFDQKPIETGTLNQGQSIAFDTTVSAASEGSQSFAGANDENSDLYKHLMKCGGNRPGYDEIQWPASPIPGVDSLVPREAGKLGCNTKLGKWPIGQTWGYGPAGTVGKRSILCFKFTKK